jgi:protein involved in ribonucleotide reduction
MCLRGVEREHRLTLVASGNVSFTEKFCTRTGEL